MNIFKRVKSSKPVKPKGLQLGVPDLRNSVFMINREQQERKVNLRVVRQMEGRKEGEWQPAYVNMQTNEVFVPPREMRSEYSPCIVFGSPLVILSPLLLN